MFVCLSVCLSACLGFLVEWEDTEENVKTEKKSKHSQINLIPKHPLDGPNDEMGPCVVSNFYSLIALVDGDDTKTN